MIDEVAFNAGMNRLALLPTAGGIDTVALKGRKALYYEELVDKMSTDEWLAVTALLFATLRWFPPPVQITDTLREMRQTRDVVGRIGDEMPRLLAPPARVDKAAARASLQRLVELLRGSGSEALPAPETLAKPMPETTSELEAEAAYQQRMRMLRDQRSRIDAAIADVSRGTSAPGDAS